MSKKKKQLMKLKQGRRISRPLPFDFVVTVGTDGDTLKIAAEIKRK